MLKRITTVALLLIAQSYLPVGLYAQLDITSADQGALSATALINNVFLGQGVQVNSIIFDGDPRSVGLFENGATYIGLDRGILMSTGFAESAENENMEFGVAGGVTSNMDVVDEDLQALIPVDVKDISKFEISFIPESDTITFRYVFASEEYPEFVCSEFNDVFGFFITGPNPDGGNYDAENIALVPDPNGNGFLDLPVAINSVNGGMIGESAADVSNCEEPNGSLNYSDYYNEVADGSFPTYDAYLDVFTAQVVLVPCEQYVIKLAIGDGEDAGFDSVVFLEAKSFNSTSLEVNLNSESVDGSIAEGCSNANIEIKLPSPATSDFQININVVPNGTFSDQADSGTDFTPIPQNIFIPQGELSTNIVLEALEDGIEEGNEFIYLDVERSICARDTFKIRIRDRFLPEINIGNDTTLCANQILQVDSGIESIPENQGGLSFSNTDRINLISSNQDYRSQIQVSGVVPDEINPNVVSRICVDRLVGRHLYNYDIYLKGPDGQLLELSTDNGFHNLLPECEMEEIDPMCIDTFLNTCFTANAIQSVNNGNQNLGPSYAGNWNYTGEFRPEGNWNSFFNAGTNSNGNWELIVGLDEQLSADCQ